jgi:hypothetical protein
MALVDYNDLLEKIPRWLNKRSLDGMAGDFLALTESDIQSKLRTREMQKTVEAPVTCPTVNLPLDWLDATRLWIGGATQALDFATPDAMPELRARYGGAPGAPVHYGLVDNVIELMPVPAQECSLWMTYYARIPTIDADHPTNWLTARDIGVYLYGSLVRAAPYLIDDARVATWDKEYTGRIQQLNASSQVALHSGGPLVRRFRGYRRGPNPIPFWGHTAS